MWQLELLSLIVPAFGALGQDFIDNGDPKLSRHAHDYNSDVATIGCALAVSGGEWTSGLEEEELNQLLKALQSRLPKRWGLMDIFSSASTQSRWALKSSTPLTPHFQIVVNEHKDEGPFPKLQQLARKIKKEGLGGYDACSQVPGQTETERAKYLDIIRQNTDLQLFHRDELKSESRLGRFLTRVRTAATHLLNVYFRDRSTPDNLELSQHPSSRGVKNVANSVYNALQRNWLCRCGQNSREARLSLIRHRLLAPKIPSAGLDAKRRLNQARYEVLLPVCENHQQWKVTNIEVAPEYSCKSRDVDEWKSVTRDICGCLARSQLFQVNLMIENDGLWHQRPVPSDDANHHNDMEPLHHLLGDGVAMSDIMQYNPREKLILCYILANSMLFLYPGSWLHSVWNSSKVYFIRRAATSSSKPFALTMPYLSVNVEEVLDGHETTIPHEQYHRHPNILALGIILLEIATGSAFARRPEAKTESSSERWNKDFFQASDLLEALDHQNERKSRRARRVSPALRQVIRACLYLKPPPNFPTNSLKDEGPIRQYILSCIIMPLATELVDGYKVRLEELHTSLEKELKAFNVNGGTRDLLPSLEYSAALEVSKEREFMFQAENREIMFEVETRTETDFCLLADEDGEEVETDRRKIKYEQKWLGYHQDVLARLEHELRDSAVSNQRRVKIAILDSGISLSAEHRSMYDDDPKIRYKDWVDGETEWRDNVGHGTHLAILLRKIAPNAALHVARVFKKTPKGTKSANTIAKAIRHAVDDWGVDIIVMSFGLGGFNHHVNQEIQHAAQSGVLMFAAASNGGKNDEIAWPAEAGNVICVHAADGLGNPSPFTPAPRDNMRTMVLGECVRSAWPPGLKSPADQKRMSGTSCAAPIAAGVAAIILDYARGFLTEAEWMNLCQVDSMRRLLGTLSGPPSRDGYCWVKHWTLFEGNSPGWIEGEIKRHLK